MSLIKANTNNLDDISKEIMTLSNKYDELITMFYQRVNGIKTKTFEWAGSDADNFINLVNKDKIVYEIIGKTLKQYSLELDSISNEINNLIKLYSE